MVKLSIIVPVYGVEAYLPKCIDSILDQTYRDFELILMDDGSPDNCGAICEEYAKKDGRITVIHQENQGVSAARNAGLDIARGEYLGFVDPDDWIQPEMYATLIAALEENQADVAVCGVQYVSADFSQTIPGFPTEGRYGREEMLAEIFGKPNRLGNGCVNKVFRREKIQQVRFHRDIRIAEDCVFLFDSFQNCQKLVKLPQLLYYVYERPRSASRSTQIPKKQAGVDAFWYLLGQCRKKCPELEGRAIDKYLDNCLRFGNENGNNSRFSRKRIKKKTTMLRLILRAWLGKKLPKAAIHGYLHEWVKL